MHTFAVIDLETTGLNPYRYDRIVELAVVLTRPGEGIIEEFSTLVNPERDIGPTHIHGITASDVIHAPKFAELAGKLVNTIKRSQALAGHNIRFDHSFLSTEFSRLGHMVPKCNLIDTMSLSGGGALSACCSRYGVQFEGRMHSALEDARATARLLENIMLAHPDYAYFHESYEIEDWPNIPEHPVNLLPRDMLKQIGSETPHYIRRLAERLVPSNDQSCPEGERDYRGLLYRVLEDRRIEEVEADSLLEMAIHWGLSFQQVEAIHQDYLSQLVKMAWADGTLTDGERNELQLVGRLLGLGRLYEEQLNNILRSDAAPAAELPESLIGKAVCFTGECGCTMEGKLIERALAERLAGDKGLIVKNSVTKSLDILVVADPHTQSSKAKKANQYGIRIIHEPVFWRMLGIKVD